MGNKKKKMLTMLTALILATSCGSGGSGSGNGNGNTTGGATPVNTNTQTGSGNVTTVTTVTEPKKDPNKVANVQYDDLEYATINNGNVAGASNGVPYSRVMGQPGVLVNQRFNSKGEIGWNSTRRYNENNVDNKPTETTYTGNGVKVAVIDSGINNSENWREIQKTTLKVEKIYTENNDTTEHGLKVLKNIEELAPRTTVYAVDADNGTYVNPKVEYFRALYNKGARIFNNSYGYSAIETNPNSPLGSQGYSFVKEAVNNGSLFIWSGGNVEAINHGGAVGNLPRLDAGLEKGWINVVGLIPKSHDANLKFENLKPLSPAGTSKNWTVSAVGVHLGDIKGIRTISFGSSFAAPKVTATAALIKEKYPFMTGDLLRQTILSTATDIGDPGVDDIYGWGLLDVEKALKGPSLFDKRLALGERVNVTLDGGSYSFDNDISGDAGLNLNGAGTLTLNGITTYTGPTTVGAGSYLKIRKNSSSRMLLEKNAVLSLEGVSVPEVVSNGTVINSGNTKIKNLSLTSEGKLVAEVNSNIKTENAKLDGEISLVNSSEEYFTKKGTNKEIITGNVSGVAKLKTESELLQVEGEITSTGVEAVVSRKDVAVYAKNKNLEEQQVNTAEQIEKTLSAIDQKLEENHQNKKMFAEGAKLQSLSSVTLDTMSGQIYASAQALTFEQNEIVNRDLSNRMVDLARSLENDKKFGVWTSGILSKGSIEKYGYSKGKTNINGGQVGADIKLDKDTIIGAAINYSDAKVKFDKFNGESKAEMTGISLYGRKNIGNAYISGRAGFGHSDTKVKRDIIINDNLFEHSEIVHKDKTLSAYFETGYDVKANGDLIFTPYVSFGTDRVTRGAFSESNTRYGMSANKKTYNMPYATIGARVNQKIGKTGITGYLAYTKDLNKKDLNFIASYNFMPEAKFEVKGINYSRNKINAGVGITTEVKEGLNIYANYDYKHSTDKSKSDNHMITTGFRLEF